MRTKTEFETLCSTEKGRKKCVAQIEELAKSHGATIEFHEFNGPREIGLELCFGPYRCMMHFEGGSRVGAFLGHWHTETCSNAKYPRNFASKIQGSLNEYHFGKATTCEGTFTGFVRSIGDGLTALAKEMAPATAA